MILKKNKKIILAGDETKADYARRWANVMLGDYIDTNSDGQPDVDANGMLITNRMGSMYVWIPRYTYRITAGENKASSELAEYDGVRKN